MPTQVGEERQHEVLGRIAAQDSHCGLLEWVREQCMGCMALTVSACLMVAAWVRPVGAKHGRLLVHAGV